MATWTVPNALLAQRVRRWYRARRGRPSSQHPTANEILATEALLSNDAVWVTRRVDTLDLDHDAVNYRISVDCNLDGTVAPQATVVPLVFLRKRTYAHFNVRDGAGTSVTVLPSAYSRGVMSASLRRQFGLYDIPQEYFDGLFGEEASTSATAVHSIAARVREDDRHRARQMLDLFRDYRLLLVRLPSPPAGPFILKLSFTAFFSARDSRRYALSDEYLAGVRERLAMSHTTWPSYVGRSIVAGLRWFATSRLFVAVTWLARRRWTGVPARLIRESLLPAIHIQFEIPPVAACSSYRLEVHSPAGTELVVVNPDRGGINGPVPRPVCGDRHWHFHFPGPPNRRQPNPAAPSGLGIQRVGTDGGAQVTVPPAGPVHLMVHAAALDLAAIALILAYFRTITERVDADAVVGMLVVLAAAVSVFAARPLEHRFVASVLRVPRRNVFMGAMAVWAAGWATLLSGDDEQQTVRLFWLIEVSRQNAGRAVVAAALLVAAGAFASTFLCYLTIATRPRPSAEGDAS